MARDRLLICVNLRNLRIPQIIYPQITQIDADYDPEPRGEVIGGSAILGDQSEGRFVTQALVAVRGAGYREV